jgi:quercetin dioxygenase-like cupin family protein
MARAIEIDSNTLEWTPTRWEGITRKGLRREEQAGSRTLLKFGPNSYMTRHMHPAGEEMLVLEGRVRVEDSWYEAGCYLYSPPGSSDDVYSDVGAVIFVSLPKPAVHPEETRPDAS